MNHVVFIRVGWMQYYGLKTEAGGPIGGGSFNRDDRGSEVENFKSRGGTCFGYAQVSRLGAGFNLERVAGEAISSDELHDVLVVSVATRPSGRQVVVGWHRPATLYRESPSRPQRGYGGYNFTARSRTAVLLPEDARGWRVPKGAAGGMGQANVFYVRTEDGRPRASRWIAEILDQIASYRGRRDGEPDPVAAAREGERFQIEAQRVVRDSGIARACLGRDKYRCRHCRFAVDRRRFQRGIDGLGVVLHVHHVRPLADGKRKTRLDDLLTLCPTCHAVAHAVARAMESDEVSLRLLRRHYTPSSR